MMRTKVDQTKCKTVGECVKTCPEVFHFEPGSKKAASKVNKVPKVLEERVALAAGRCPEDAIVIWDV